MCLWGGGGVGAKRGSHNLSHMGASGACGSVNAHVGPGQTQSPPPSFPMQRSLSHLWNHTHVGPRSNAIAPSCLSPPVESYTSKSSPEKEPTLSLSFSSTG